MKNGAPIVFSSFYFVLTIDKVVDLFVILYSFRPTKNQTHYNGITTEIPEKATLSMLKM